MLRELAKRCIVPIHKNSTILSVIRDSTNEEIHTKYTDRKYFYINNSPQTNYRYSKILIKNIPAGFSMN